MGKIKKVVSDDKKINKCYSALSAIEKRKTSKNRHKILGAILPALQKSLKKVDDFDVNLVKPVKGGNVNSSKERKSPKVKQKRIINSKKSKQNKKQSTLKNNKTPQVKRKNVLSEKQNSKQPVSEVKEDMVDKISKRIDKIVEVKNKKSKKETSKENKDAPGIRKTTSFKSKTPKFKVKTALIFSQRHKREDKSDNDLAINLEKDAIISGIKALFQVIEKSKNDKALFEDELPIHLQFSSIKIGKTPSRTLRIPLKHSLLRDVGEICLITDDMKGHHPKEYEKTIEHYENLLQEKGITNIKTIMPYYQLRTDYSEFELKRKLVELYDVFLVDAKLSGYVFKKLAKIFRVKRKLPIPIKLGVNNLKEQINFALTKTSTNLHPRGDNFVIQVAHSEMAEDQIYENIVEACTNLAKQFPGGWTNVRGLNLKTPKSTSIPIYYTLSKFFFLYVKPRVLIHIYFFNFIKNKNSFVS